MAKLWPLFLVISIGSFWTFSHASRSIGQRVKPASHITVVPRSRMGPAPKLGQKPVHPLSTLRHRAALVTKPGATVRQATIHATSIAPPYQGGPSLASTRVIRTSSVTTATTTTPSTGGSTSTGATATGGSTTTAAIATTTVAVASSSTAASTSSATTTPTSTSSTTTSSTTSTSSTTASTATTTCAACTYAQYHRCSSGSPDACLGQCCTGGHLCSYNAANAACGTYVYCCQ